MTTPTPPPPLTTEALDELERLHAALLPITSRRWAQTKDREDGTAQVYSPSRGPLRMVVPVAETEGQFAPYLVASHNAMGALLASARRAAEMEAFLAEHGDDLDDAVCHAPFGRGMTAIKALRKLRKGAPK